MFGLPTGVIADDMAAGKPVPTTIKPPMAGTEGISLMPGGSSIMKGGKMIGSIACGGPKTEQGEPICRVGIDDAFPKQ